MKKISLTIVMLIACCLIPAVSAETIIDETMSEYENTGGTVSPIVAYNPAGSNYDVKTIRFTSIENHQNLPYIGVSRTYQSGDVFKADGEYKISYSLFGETHPATMYITNSRDFLGSITSSRILVFFDEWEIGTHIGAAKIVLSEGMFNARSGSSTPENDLVSLKATSESKNGLSYPYTITVASTKEWKNRLIVSLIHNSYEYELIRTLNSRSYASLINLSKGDELVFTDYDIKDVYGLYPTDEIDKITISSRSKNYVYNLDASTSDPTPTTIYARNSQTNVLIANSHIVISANVDNEFHEIVNQTLPSGTYTGNLQPTGGGLPNPDFYRLIVTAEGYNSIMPYIDFEIDGATSIYAYLDPTGGAPEDENNTFIDFYVRDMSANPISGATVNFGGYTLITNSAGYTMFEVDKNKTYSWTVSKSGYGSLTGNAVIGGNARHTINTVLAPAVTPTIPTAIPTSTSISPTPTMTAPTGEPVSNWLEWFAAHFGMVLGGGAEIGKIFMWLCFSVPVGVYVGKEAKAGAAGFMAGAGIVTLFFVLIGWVPIWLLVFIALIIGLLYAKVFNNSDTGGGR